MFEISEKQNFSRSVYFQTVKLQQEIILKKCSLMFSIVIWYFPKIRVGRYYKVRTNGKILHITVFLNPLLHSQNLTEEK